MTTIKDRLRRAASLESDADKFEALTIAIAEIELLEREKKAIMQGQADLQAHIVAMREILGAEKGEDTIDACRRIVADLAKARSKALEEAARACEGYAIEISGKLYRTGSKTCATAIRALKEKP